MFSLVELSALSLPATVALSGVALLGYMVGRWQKVQVVQSDLQSRREIQRATVIARELEAIAREVRKSLARHHASVARFKTRVQSITGDGPPTMNGDLCREAEEILGPTMLLASDLAKAYDQIRRQSNQLMTFVEVRTDQLTGVCNRRALDDTLKSLVAMHNRYDLPFSVAMFDIDYFKNINDERGHVAGDQVLREVAQLIDHTARETDIVTRYGGEEFVVLMPQTGLTGACIFAERARQAIERKLGVTISGGTTTAVRGETPEMIIERADAALYRAKQSGRNQITLHDGQEMRPASEAVEMAEESNLAQA